MFREDRMAARGKTHYLVTYRDPKDNKVVSLRVRKVADSDLGLSFVAISDFIFKEGSLIIDPSEEDLRDRFAHTRRLHLSIYSILSIEEVGKSHKGLKFKQDKSNVLVLPRDKPPE